MDEHDDQDCNTTLRLGLNQYGPQSDNSRIFCHDLSIPYHPSNFETIESSSRLKSFGENEKERSKEDGGCSSYSKNCGRKKLRLTRDQTTLLEDSFKQHSILAMAQKQALAEKLSLKPRQVEVWFQNRRARTKLKQTEIDCKILKKNCERLSEENRRLKKQLLDLRSAMKIQKPPPEAVAPPQQPCFLHIPVGTKLETCPSCENKIEKSRGGGGDKEAAAETVMDVVHRHEPKGDQQRMAT